MTVTWCPTCDAALFEWTTNHQCPPAFRVAQLDGDDEHYARTIRAHDAEEAAEEWAERDDSDGEYGIADGAPVDVIVTAPDGARTKWRVTGEYQAVYDAEEIE